MKKQFRQKWETQKKRESHMHNILQKAKAILPAWQAQKNPIRVDMKFCKFFLLFTKLCDHKTQTSLKLLSFDNFRCFVLCNQRKCWIIVTVLLDFTILVFFTNFFYLQLFSYKNISLMKLKTCSEFAKQSQILQKSIVITHRMEKYARPLAGRISQWTWKRTEKKKEILL